MISEKNRGFYSSFQTSHVQKRCSLLTLLLDPGTIGTKSQKASVAFLECAYKIGRNVVISSVNNYFKSIVKWGRVGLNHSKLVFTGRNIKGMDYGFLFESRTKTYLRLFNLLCIYYFSEVE